MIDMEQKLELKWNNANRKWFVNKGYSFTNWGDKFIVKAKDLSPGSSYNIKFTCDYCGSEIIQHFNVYTNGHKKYPKDACLHCSGKKTAEIRHIKIVDDMRSKVLKQAEEKGYEIDFNWDNYKNQNTRINYICPKHGKREMSCANFIKGHGCPRCGDESVSQKRRFSKEQVINKIESVNGNKLLNPDDYDGNMKRNLLVKCSCGELFYTSIAKYEKKYRCSKCAKSESIGENRISNFLNEHDIDFVPQYKYMDCKDKRPLPFDFKITNKNICIEFDGMHHFEPIRGEEQLKYVQKHDEIKNEYCKKNNIDLIRIKYDDYKNIDKILTKELLIT